MTNHVPKTARSIWLKDEGKFKVSVLIFKGAHFDRPLKFPSHNFVGLQFGDYFHPENNVKPRYRPQEVYMNMNGFPYSALVSLFLRRSIIIS